MAVLMDERLVEWLQLLPPDARFVVHGAPKAVTRLLGDRAAADGDSYLGWGIGPPQVRSLGHYRSVVLVNPRGGVASELEAAGFTHVREFSVLPSLASPQLFLCSVNPRVAMRGTDLLPTYGRLTRLRKAIVQAAARCGQLHRVGGRVVVARRRETDLEIKLREVTGLSEMHLTIWTGSVNLKRKPTIQMVASDGAVRAFAKVASSPAAKEFIEREHSRLEDLAEHRELHGLVPQVMGCFSIGDSLVTISTAGPSREAPRVFTEAHHQFLTSLAKATSQRKAFSQSGMWRNVWSTFEKIDPQLSPTWRARLSPSMERIRTHVGPMEMTLYTAHRDFKPSNTRLFPDGRLFVLDWEACQPESTPLYDFLAFQWAQFWATGPPERVYRQIERACRRWHPEVDPQFVPQLLLIFLVDRTAQQLSVRLQGQQDPAGLRALGALLDERDAWFPAATPSAPSPSWL